jgi:hypothetical protein
LLVSEKLLLEEVNQFGGPSHFDPNGQSPFTFAIIMLCCGRFGDAIAYIWSRGKTLPAVHLTVGCLHYGLILPHVPLTHNPFLVTQQQPHFEAAHRGQCFTFVLLQNNGNSENRTVAAWNLNLLAFSSCHSFDCPPRLNF